MDDFTYMYMGQQDDNDDRPDEPTPQTASAPASAAPSIHSTTTTATTDDHDDGDGDSASTATAAAPADHPHEQEHHHRHKHSPETPKKRRGFRDFLSKANLQDQLLDKLFQQVIPTDGFAADDGDGDFGDKGATSGGGGGGTGEEGRDGTDDAAADQLDQHHERPGFSVPIMSNNFRRFNARIGVVFRFQKRVERLLGWRRPAHTVAFLGVYTFVCLDPYLLTLLPPLILLLGVLIPGFAARHPTPATATTATAAASSSSSFRGPPLAPPRTVKPVKELSRDFFRNMGDLQNSMDDFSVAHDKVVQLVVPATNFSDEAFSSALFVVLCGVATFLSVAAHLLPWRLLFLVGGWLAVGGSHPAVKRALRAALKKKTSSSSSSSSSSLSSPTGDNPEEDQKDSPLALWNAWVASDIILDEAPETREVEIFELQRRSAAADEWEPWVFSPSPYDPLSQPRLGRGATSPAHTLGNSYAYAYGYGYGASPSHPPGVRFFEDVLPPPGWEWSEKKWALDLWSRDWVEERIITGVEVETEGERWVYDMYNEHEQQQRAAAVAAAAVGTGGHGDSDFDDAGSASFLHPPPSSAASRARRQLLGRTAAAGGRPRPGWEESNSDVAAAQAAEAEEGIGRRGEWRRRRWVRMVKRKKITTTS